MKFDLQNEFPKKKYLIIQEEIEEIMAVCYDEAKAIRVAEALEQASAAGLKTEIVTAKGEKHYKAKREEGEA